MGNSLRLLIVVVLVLGLAPPAAAADAPLTINGAVTVNADGVIALVQTSADLIIIDNRTRADYDVGHIESAIPLVDSEITEEAALARIVKSKDTPVLFYCNGVKCGRAANATTKAVSWGYSRVYYYALGLAEWNRRGLPLIR
jgi:rhodanese-related sulfurtransferase